MFSAEQNTLPSCNHLCFGQRSQNRLDLRRIVVDYSAILLVKYIAERREPGGASTAVRFQAGS